MPLQTPVQRYWKNLLKYVEEGKLTPEMVGCTDAGEEPTCVHALMHSIPSPAARACAHTQS